MRIALAAAKFRNGDIAFNVAQIRRYMREAKAAGAELVCFGEAFLQGFDAYSWEYESDSRIAISTDDALFGDLMEETGRTGIDLLFGFLERQEDRLYSSCALMSGGKLLHLYRRISLGWKEYTRTDHHYCEGSEVQVFEYRGRKCAIALCGDLWEYTERFRLGQDLLFWPLYVNDSPEEWYGGERKEYAQKAGEACAVTLMINCVDDGGGNPPAQGGCCLFINGQLAAECPMGEEGMLLAEV